MLKRFEARVSRERRRFIVPFCLFLAILTAGAGTEVAGQTTGRVVGRVVDGETGRGLVGALVVDPGSSRRTLAGIDGRYILSDVPAGGVDLTVSFLGYGSKTVTGVRVEPGTQVNADISMFPAALAIEGITVTAAGERGTIGQALDQQRSAAGVTSAVTSEQISRSPDGDAAAAVQRVSGVTVQDGKYVFVRGLGERYTTTTLNGSRVPSPEPERKMVPLDLFPSGLLQSITTAKTFMPNLSGDFSGAQVDIRTREYPAGRQIAFSLSQGYNTAATGSTLPMAPRAGGEWYAAATQPRQLPAAVAANTRPSPGPETNTMVSSMRNAWSPESRTGSAATSASFSVGGSDDVLGRNLGYLFSTSYSLSDDVNLGTIRENTDGDHYEGTLGRQSVLLGGLFNLSTMLGTHSRFSLNNTYNRTADNEAQVEEGYYENHGSNIRIERLRYVERVVRSTQLEAQHQITTSHRFDWAVTTSRVSRAEPDRSEFVTWLDSATPTWYNQEGAFRAYGGLEEDSFEGRADYQFDFGRTNSNTIRAGGLIRSTDRDAFDNGYSIRSRDWTPTDPRWQLPAEQIFDGRFANDSDDSFEMGIFNAGGAYGAKDRIAAGYLMMELSLTSRLRLIGGARIERSELEVSYEDLLANRGVANPEYTDILPAATLNFDLTESQKLRLSVSQTLARPEYREVAPICYRGGLGEEQRCGNPDLRRTLIQNFDFRWEHYPRYGETVAIALFAKRFDDPIESRYQGRSGTNSLWFQNAESAVNYGVELEAMKGLDFLGEAFAPLSMFANATLMKSEVSTGQEGDDKRPMMGQAPYVVNTGLTWARDGAGSSATVLFNMVGERIINARPSGSTVDNMLEMPRPALDVSFRFPVFGTIAGKLDMKNLLDSPYEVKQGDRIRAYYRSGRSFSLGASWSH